MPAPSPDLVVENPAPLNPYRSFPFRFDEFPADTILGPLGRLTGFLKSEEPMELPANPNRKEAS